jgi:hypothetical protein
MDRRDQIAELLAMLASENLTERLRFSNVATSSSEQLRAKVLASVEYYNRTAARARVLVATLKVQAATCYASDFVVQ